MRHRCRFPDESVDAVITDPPYGSNVQYAELSVIWNAWYAIYRGLDRCVYKEEEAVVSRKSNYKGAKDENDYEELLYEVYSESARVLKPGGYLVFTFNNKNIKVWRRCSRRWRGRVLPAGRRNPVSGLYRIL